MRKSMSAPAATAALLIALVAGHGAAHAAPNDCVTAPSGAAPKGQHWYYHLDRAGNRKCWYLRDLGAAAATPSAAASQQADNPAPAQPAAAPSPPPPATTANAFGGAEASAPPAAATPVSAQAAAPSQPAATSGAATLWSDPPPPAAPVQDSAIAPSQPAPAVAADPPVRRTPAKKRAAAPRETQAAAPVSDKASTTSVGQNVLVILLAALLAGGVFAVFAVLRRRKPVIRAAGSGPRFGSRPDREDAVWLKWPRRGDDAPPAAPIQNSLIPQQVNMTRQSAPRR